jgi:hypothetical protein
MGTGVLSEGVKRMVFEDGHSPGASAEVEKMWIYIHYIYIPPIRLNGAGTNL